MKFGHTLGQVELWSDVPAGRDILWPSVILLQVRLTRSLGQVDILSDVPPMMRLQVMMKFDHTLGQVELCSDVPPGRDILWPSVILLQVRLTRSLGQVDILSDAPPMRRLQVRLTFGQVYPLLG